MKRAIGLIFIYVLGSVAGAFAQRIHWATKVVQVSSETKTEDFSYAAKQALGKPNSGPGMGDSQAAWQPAQPDSGEEFLKVSFDTLMPVRQITIVENYGAGCINQVWLSDPKGDEKLVYSNSAAFPSHQGKVWSIPLESLTRYPVAALTVVLNTTRRPGYTQIDAIGISQDTVPFKPTIHLSKKYTDQKISKENLGESINSKVNELTPLIASDGKTLYFTRWNHPENLGKPVKEGDDEIERKKQDIWVSHQINGVWQKAQNMGPPLNNEDHNCLFAISTDLRTAYLVNEYDKSGKMSLGISSSRKTPTGWTFPTPMKIENFDILRQHGRYSTEYALSADERILLMSVYRADSFGGRDLYVSFLKAPNLWSTPKNLGKIINTPEEDGSPFLAADGKTLYFSSKGHPGYGEHDIFVTRRLDNTWQNWSEPENLGPMINTPSDDVFFSIPASGDYAYLSSTENSYGKEDIFRIRTTEAIKPEPVVIVSGSVLHSVTRKPVNAKIFAQVLQGEKDSIQTEYNPATGEYKFILPSKKLYGLNAAKEGFYPIAEELDLREEKRYRELRKNLLLIPIEAGAKITMNTVYFEQSQPEVDSSSFAELRRLVQIMKEHPTMTILMEGHTDNQGDFDANLVLSQQRVDHVKSYLVFKGISANRIVCKGYGSSRPLVSNYSEENRRKNRRVEFTILTK
ncbi:OmpA family protein [Siphonobacter sp. SORGH_AS_1065]|uniref:OmpA family protein n=1 Tax=Siphonobacter sp. SORGH_AS_1065 TaxID=3041795 RepID=UPI002784C799|nr:OmpA family protein [Siphonobacter sp. SORGH_AS_1065]MDQ1088832.1 outer membrane protein OmpA-like peptidoglycan-associated protein [Siphonobacter sp. SORGH_AS_1065]